MPRSPAVACVVLIGLFVLAGPEARAQVGGATFTMIVASPFRGVSWGTLSFDDAGGFTFLSQTGTISTGSYAEAIDGESGESSLTLTAGTAQPISGIAVAQTMHGTINNVLPVTLLWGLSYAGRNRFYVFLGYYFPTLPVLDPTDSNDSTTEF